MNPTTEFPAAEAVLHDITTRRQSEQALRTNAARLQTLFEYSPHAICDEDFSAVRNHFDHLRAAGVTDFCAHFAAHPDEVIHCAGLVKVRNVNQQTLRILEAPTKADVLTHIPSYFDAAATSVFREELITLAAGGMSFTGEATLQLPNGKRVTCAFQLAVVPGSEQTLDQVLFSFEDVTTRRLHEQTLRENAMQLSLVIRGGDIGYWDWDFVTGGLVVNDRWMTNLGLDPQGPPPTMDLWNTLVHPEDVPKIVRLVEEVIKNPAGRNGEVEIRARHAAGHYVWILDKFSVVARAADGSPLRVVGTHLNITARKEAELALTRTTNLLERTGEMGKIGGWSLDLPAMKLSWTRETFRIAEIEPPLEPPLADGINLFAPEARPTIAAAVQAAIDTGTPYDLELPLITAKGNHRWVQTQGFAEIQDDKVVRIYGTFQDITAQKLAGKALRESEERYRTLVEHSPYCIHEIDLVGRLTSMNAAGLKMLGVDDVCAIQEQPYLDAVGPRDRERIAGLLACALAGQASEFVFQGHNGLEFQSSFVPIMDGRGVVQRLMGLSIDITAQKLAADNLRQSEARVRAILQASPVPMALNDKDGNITFLNLAFTQTFGYELADIPTLTDWRPKAYPDPDYRQRATEAWQAEFLRSAETQTAFAPQELTIRRKDGTERVVLGTAAPLEDAFAGNHLVSLHDITERRQLQNQLRESQKMEAIGQLAGGIAHDFNNILSVIQGYGTLLQAAPTFADVADAAEQIVKAAGRAADLTRQLLAFSRRQAMQPRVLDLNEIVTGMLKMLGRVLGEDLWLGVNLDSRALLTRADAGMLEQVLMNLAVNARDAMPDGGRLEVATGEVTLTAAEVKSLPDLAPGHHVWLRVSDTGSGIAPEHLARIFEPFFTTKEVGKGTGLGLATVFGIVKQHGGAVTVASEVGRGTTFKIYLPATEAEVPAPVIKPAAPATRGGGETILLVEDDPDVRKLTRRVLERAGYQILEAADGIAGERVGEEHTGEIRLLLTDIMMPEGVSGRTLATHLEAKNPRLQVIFTSGYDVTTAGRELSLHEGEEFLQKPVPLLLLLETVRRSLDR